MFSAFIFPHFKVIDMGMFDNSQVRDIQTILPNPVAPHRVEEVELVKVSRDKDAASKSFRSISFLFQDKYGAQLQFREFAPSRTINGKALTNEEIEKNAGMAISRLAHISRAYLSEEVWKKIAVPANLQTVDKLDEGWDAYITIMGQALGLSAAKPAGVATGVKTALKVIYALNKGKYYSALPKVPPFVSTENHYKEFRTDNPQYDIFVIPSTRPDAPSAPAPAFGASGGGASFGAAPAATGPSFGSAPAGGAAPVDDLPF
jgi:hypothetical protein